MSESRSPKETKSLSLAIELAATPWESLEMFEAHGYLHFPENLLRKRKGAGDFEEIPIAIRIPRPKEMRQARVAARKMALEEGLDLKLDKDLIDDLENMHILTVSLRNRTHPHEQWVFDVTELEKDYDKSSLAQMWAKMNALSEIIDPRPEDLSKEEVLAVIAAIAKTREIYPLLALGSASQASCIRTMANLSLTYLASNLSSSQLEDSTPE